MIPADLVPQDCRWPIVLGIDPGTRVLGYGALVVAPEGPRLVACGVLAPRARAPVAARLAEIQTGLVELLSVLRPGLLALERAFHSKNVQAAFRIGEARGVVLAAASRAGIEILELAPAAAKKAVLGHGGASKEQVARMVARLLGTGRLAVPADATDALALAFAGVKRIAVPRSLLRPVRRSPLPRGSAALPMAPHGGARQEGRRARQGR